MYNVYRKGKKSEQEENSQQRKKNDSLKTRLDYNFIYV